jgi:hypothetical protein
MLWTGVVFSLLTSSDFSEARVAKAFMQKIDSLDPYKTLAGAKV